MTDIATIPKNSREVLRISLDEFRGYPLLNLRVWYDADGEMRPSRKGLALRLDMLANLQQALNAASQEAMRKGLYAEDAV